MGSWSKAAILPPAMVRGEQAFTVATLKMRISAGGKSIRKDYCAWPIVAKIPIAASRSLDSKATGNEWKQTDGLIT